MIFSQEALEPSHFIPEPQAMGLTWSIWNCPNSAGKKLADLCPWRNPGLGGRNFSWIVLLENPGFLSP